MTLRERQSLFARLVGMLIDFAYYKGYEVTFGDAYRDPRAPYGHPRSLHRDRLAVDLNLFYQGAYLTSTEDHRPLGNYWKALHPDNRWGGDFGDGNHYSNTPDERA